MDTVPDLRQRIFAEATRLFSAQGYKGISMREIAEACDVSKAGLYYHFKDKEDLFLAILQQNLDELARLVQAAQNLPGSRAQISHLVSAILSLPHNHRAVMRLAGQERVHLSPAARAAFDLAYQQKFILPVTGILRQGIQAGAIRPAAPEQLTWILLGMLHPFFTLSHEQGSQSTESNDATIQFILNTFWEGVQARD